MKRTRIGAAWWIALLIVGGLLPGLAVAAPSALRIQAGDLVRVDVASRTDLSGDFLVAQDGNLTLPVAGAVHAAGRTEAELASDLSRRYSLIDREIPRVLVTILRSSSRRVLVLGAVVLPGAYDYSDSMNPWDAIARAGGASDDAILTSVEIIPGDGSPGRKMETADVQTAIQAGTLEALPRLRAGDTVRVPRRTGGAGAGNLVYVMGAVTQPGPKSLDLTPDLLSLLVFSIPTADANLGKIQVVRRAGKGAEHLRVDARLYLQGAIEPGNIPLREGDTVYIERSTGGILARLGVLSGLIGLTTGIIALTR